ncbi:MAG: hypothetical protein KJ607_07620 [Bacteroidetes bacterium]|nr:hypothetical protein [Bacteroidota bacterium]
MKNKLFLLMELPLLASGCKKKEEQALPPVITLKTGASYTGNGSVVEIGRILRFGVKASGHSANLTNFVIKKQWNGTWETMLDTGLNAASLDVDKVFYQGIEDTAAWSFTVMDRNRQTAGVGLTIYKDPDSQFGGILHFSSITMGYQGNTSCGHFLDPVTGTVFMPDSSFSHQNDIEILTYYIVDEDLPSPVFSSPGEYDNFSTEAGQFYPDIISWATRNYTLWDISVDNDPVSVTDFDNAHNDSLLIVSYHDVWGKKKFKWATPGRVIPFLSAKGKKGLVKVIATDYQDTGTIEFAVKIQI